MTKCEKDKVKRKRKRNEGKKRLVREKREKIKGERVRVGGRWEKEFAYIYTSISNMDR